MGERGVAKWIREGDARAGIQEGNKKLFQVEELRLGHGNVNCHGAAGKSMSTGALMVFFWALTRSLVHFIRHARNFGKEPGEVAGPGYQGLRVPF